MIGADITNGLNGGRNEAIETDPAGAPAEGHGRGRVADHRDQAERQRECSWRSSGRVTNKPIAAYIRANRVNPSRKKTPL